jgi:hypothetical protein
MGEGLLPAVFEFFGIVGATKDVLRSDGLAIPHLDRFSELKPMGKVLPDFLN